MPEFFELSQLSPTPWKNGGGVTCEIVCVPPGAGIGDFDWRVSIASIAADGPFSAFPGVDRVIVLLDGSGVRLRSRDGKVDHRLDTPLAPFAFAGELPIDCSLLAGPSSDFNVMTRRGLLHAELRVLRQATELPACTQGLLFAARGAWQARTSTPAGDAAFPADATLQADAGLWWNEAASAWNLTPTTPDAALIAVQLWPGPP
ncbi:MAG: HutD/Ves family protein [Burkholderiaceae bacterium]